jgi:DNA-binding GntR family transcriptional regulator
VSNAAARRTGRNIRAIDDAPKAGRAPALPAHGATVAFIVERLREDIFKGSLAPGSRLVECDLTARFAVSRGPVREALRRLDAEGLIEHWPHRGALVRRLSARTISELFEIRIEMEALAAQRAAGCEDAEARARFVEAIRPIFGDGARQAPDYLAENAAFHDAMMALAGNLQLRDLASRLRLPLIMAQVGDILTPETLAASVREHRAIARAILGHDGTTAANLMRAHLERAAALAIRRRADAGSDEGDRKFVR